LTTRQPFHNKGLPTGKSAAHVDEDGPSIRGVWGDEEPRDQASNAISRVAFLTGENIYQLVTGVREMISKINGLPVLDADESEEITVAVNADDLEAGDPKESERHPVAIALRRKRGVDDARVTTREVLIGRGDQWYRYGALKLVEE